MRSSKLRFLSASDVGRALPMGEAIDAMKEAFLRLRRGEVDLPPRMHIEMRDRRGTALLMPSRIRSDGLSVKVVTLFEDNVAKGLPRLHGIVLALDGETGAPIGVLDGATLTAIRTGAASGLATDLLAREDARIAAVLGAGVQARTQIEAVCAVRRIERVLVFDPRGEAARDFAREMSARLGVEIVVAGSSSECVRGADIVCAATSSPRPVFDDRDLGAGVHVNAIGSYQPWVQEIPTETVLRARLVVDHLESAISEAGDLVVPLQAGLMTREHIWAELGEIVAGEKPGRTSSEEVTLFKSVGIAVQDLVAAARALARAEASGLGTVVTL